MTERERLGQAITALEAQRAVLGDDVVETALVPLRQQLVALQIEGESTLRGGTPPGHHHVRRPLRFYRPGRVVGPGAGPGSGQLVLVFEDLHWADPTSVELLEHILALTEDVPLVVVCGFRPQEKAACWRVRETAIDDFSHRYTQPWLEVLSSAEGGASDGKPCFALPAPGSAWRHSARPHINRRHLVTVK